MHANTLCKISKKNTKNSSINLKYYTTSENLIYSEDLRLSLGLTQLNDEFKIVELMNECYDQNRTNKMIIQNSILLIFIRLINPDTWKWLSENIVEGVEIKLIGSPILDIEAPDCGYSIISI